jgi:hypothetical protein
MLFNISISNGFKTMRVNFKNHFNISYSHHILDLFLMTSNLTSSFISNKFVSSYIFGLFFYKFLEFLQTIIGKLIKDPRSVEGDVTISFIIIWGVEFKLWKYNNIKLFENNFLVLCVFSRLQDENIQVIQYKLINFILCTHKLW